MPDAIPPLNLPPYAFRVQERAGKAFIFDAVRQKYVRLTPEEWVRQHFVRFLVEEQRVPAALVAIEMGFNYQQMPRRADVVVHARTGMPLLMAECKAPDVSVRQATFDQVARYNKVVQAKYLVVTNGLTHCCWMLDPAAHTYRFLDELPVYEAL
ncbi:MAG: type I restriction enzyme HsdR N-terminal domain-containing protein [Rhodothermales bacterium]